MTSQAQPKCEFCDKYDLPVLPTRFSIAPAEAGMPQAKPDDFGKAFGAINAHYHYTQRLLRSGYLYVYDEARKRWEGYLVTNGAYFMRFEVGKPVPQGYTAGRQPCDRAGHKEVAGMVTIRDSKNATKVWFGFSDVKWTTDTLKQHENAAYRAKHMQVLDVKKALAKAAQPNVQPIKELGKQVAEYAIEHDMASWYDNALSPSAQAAGQLGHCSFAFNWRKDRLQQTIEAADNLRKGAGVILSLYDPVAVARELAVAMQYRLDAFPCTAAQAAGVCIELHPCHQGGYSQPGRTERDGCCRETR